VLACGLVGGPRGGFLGSNLSTRLYYSKSCEIERQARQRGMIDPKLLLEELPLMCTPSPECPP